MTNTRQEATVQAECEWKPIGTAPLDVEIETKIDDGRGVRNVATLIGYRREVNCRVIWFLPDRSMYVYYEPTHWRHPR